MDRGDQDLERLDRTARRALGRAGGLLTGPQVADLLGVAEQRVRQLRAAPDFPAPFADLPNGPVWTRAAIDAWAHRRGRSTQP